MSSSPRITVRVSAELLDAIEAVVDDERTSYRNRSDLARAALYEFLGQSYSDSRDTNSMEVRQR